MTMRQKFMEEMHSSYADLSDGALVAEVSRLGIHERDATAQLVAALAEFDTRKLYLAEGCASLYVNCRRVLRLSEHAAYSRIQAATRSDDPFGGFFFHDTTFVLRRCPWERDDRQGER